AAPPALAAVLVPGDHGRPALRSGLQVAQDGEDPALVGVRGARPSLLKMFPTCFSADRPDTTPNAKAPSDHGRALSSTEFPPAPPRACSAGSGPGRCGASDSEVPVAAREVQCRNDQEEGCPCVGAVREADDARGRRGTATGNTRDPEGADVAVFPWVDQA